MVELIGLHRTVDAALIPQQFRKSYWKQRHVHFANQIWLNVVSLKGWWVKVGQFLSSRTDLLKSEYVESLTRLQDMIPASSFDEIKEIIEQELDININTVFQYIEPKAIAAASIGQVHRGKLITDQDIIIKVQHKNVRKLLSQDMRLLTRLSWGLKYFEKVFQIDELLEEWQKQAELELNFLFEAHNQMIAKGLATRLGLPIVIPSVYKKLTTEKIMVQEFIDGIKITDLELIDMYGLDKKKICYDLITSFASLLLRYGILHGDPHPGNILIQIDNITANAKPVLLDWGLVKIYDNLKRIAFAQLIIACNNMDIMGILESLVSFGFKLKKKKKLLPVDPEIYYTIIKTLYSGNNDLNNANVNYINDNEQRELVKQKNTISKHNPLSFWPKDIVFFFRVAGLLDGIMKTLKVKVPFFEILYKEAENVMFEYVQQNTKINDNLNIKNKEHNYNSNYSVEYYRLEYRIKCIIDNYYRNSNFGAIQVYAIHKSKTILNLSYGYIDKYNKYKVDENSLFSAFTLANTLLSLSILNLVKKNKVKLTDKLSDWWDSLVLNEYNKITIKHLLTGRSGLHNWLPSNLTINKLVNYEEFVKNCEKVPPHCEVHNCKCFGYFTHTYLLNKLLESIIKLSPPQLYIKYLLSKEFSLDNVVDSFFYPLVEQYINDNSYTDSNKAEEIEEGTSKVKKQLKSLRRIFINNNKTISKAKVSRSKIRKNKSRHYTGSKLSTERSSEQMYAKTIVKALELNNLYKLKSYQSLMNKYSTTEQIDKLIVHNYREINGAKLADNYIKAESPVVQDTKIIEYNNWLKQVNINMIQSNYFIPSKYTHRDIVIRNTKLISKFGLVKTSLSNDNIVYLSHFDLLKQMPIIFDPMLYNSKMVQSLFVPPSSFRTSAKALAIILSKSKQIVGSKLYKKINKKPYVVDFTTSGLLGTSGYMPIHGLGFQLFPLVETVRIDNKTAKNIITKQYYINNQKSHNKKYMCYSLQRGIYYGTNITAMIQSVNKVEYLKKDIGNIQSITNNNNDQFLVYTESNDNKFVSENVEKNLINDLSYAFGWSDMHGSICMNVPCIDLTLTILVNNFGKGKSICREVVDEILDTFGLSLLNNYDYYNKFANQR